LGVSWTTWLLIAASALAVGTLLSTLVQSLRDLSKPVLEDLAEAAGDEGLRGRVRRILDDPDGHAATVALPRTAFNIIFAIAVVMAIVAMRKVATPGLLEAALGAAIASLMLWVFSAAIPSSIAKYAGEGTILAWSRLLRFAHVVGAPLTAIARLFDEGARRATGKPSTDEPESVQQELLTIVEEAQSEGGVDQTEADMIEAVVRLREKTVAQVMTPRPQMQALELINDLSAVTAYIRRVGHSRIPVFEGTLDHVVGVFYVKDLMKWLAGESARSGKVFSLRGLLRPAFFIPETKTIRDLLPEMLAKRTHIAIAIDEFGGTAGLITIEDIVEEVFGEIRDEHEEPSQVEREVIVDLVTRSAEIDASLNIADANEALSPLSIELPESEEYDTVAGFVTVTLGRIPSEGDTFTVGELTFTVVGAEATRVTRVRVEVGAPATDAADEAAALEATTEVPRREGAEQT